VDGPPQTGRAPAPPAAFVELATGLNRWDKATRSWVPAAARFERTPAGHFVARQTQHRVVLARNLHSSAAVDLLTPDGLRLRSSLRGIVVRDPHTGREHWLANVQPSAPELAAPDAVVYPDALRGLRADLRYRLGRNWFEQDVILREAIPVEWLQARGLDPRRAEIVVLTEFFDPPAPCQEPRPRQSLPGSTPADARLVFGAMSLEGGSAFALSPGASSQTGVPSIPDLGPEGVRIGKAWVSQEGRSFLRETVAYADLAPLLEGLPRVFDACCRRRREEALWAGGIATSPPHVGAYGRSRFPAADELAGLGRPAQGARGSPRGVVLDYVLVASQADFTFRADTTYYVTGEVDLAGTTTLEGGAVIKFPPGNTAARIRVRGPLVCATGPYRPAIFTARDDNSVGTPLPDSTGAPTGAYGGYALDCHDTGQPVELRHLRISHVTVGVAFHGNLTNRLRHAQITHARFPIYASSAGPVTLENLLVAHVQTGGRVIQNLGTPATVQAAHLTVDTAPEMSTWTLHLRNSLLVALARPGGYSGDHNTALPSGSGVFQTAGAGTHYLGSESPLREAGAADLPADLLAELQSRTTEAPVESSEPITAATVWQPRTRRRPTAPDLGYHYPILDYLCAELTVTNTSLTLSGGVVVGVHGPAGLRLAGASRLRSEGSPTAPNRIVRAVTLQEQVPSAWPTAVTDTLVADEDNATAASALHLRFTELVVPGGYGHHFRGGGRLGTVVLLDCELTGGHLSWWGAGVYPRTVRLLNNVFDRVALGLGFGTDPTLTVHAHNNLFRACPAVNLNAATPNAWRWDDNLFDTTSLWQYYGAVANRHNAYWNCPRQIGPPGVGNRTLTALRYVPDAWGRRWYAQATPSLVDAGSRPAGAAGLYRHTADPGQTVEGDTPVDIGFHYVPLVNGAPLDTDGDGLPDYREDLDGSGHLDGGETSPELVDTDYDGRSDAEESAAGTDPGNPDSHVPGRLGYWRFNGPSWLTGEQGQQPLAHPGTTAVASFDGTALRVHGSGAFVRYRELEAGGRANLNLRQGGVRFWFRPDWTSGTGPGHWACLLAVGEHGDTAGGWFALRISPDGRTLEFTANGGTGATTPALKLEKPIQLSQGTWYQFTLGYGKHPAATHHVVRLYVDDDETLLEPLAGMPFPPPATRAAGFALGNDLAGQQPADGALDEFETFNHLLGRVNAQWIGHILTAAARPDPVALELEWRTNPNQRITLERRPTNSPYWTALATALEGWQFRDETVEVDREYEYRVTVEGSQPPLALTLRAICPSEPPQDRGQLVLVVEQGLVTALAPELERLQQDLATDGWTVLTHLAPRHDDHDWSRNPGPIQAIKRFVRDTYDADPFRTRGVFLLGHVPIPYSGLAVFPDGHVDHQGAWPADGYYGNMATDEWTDTGTWQPSSPALRPQQVNLPGDGKFDQDAFPPDLNGRRLALFVGRVDFANLPAFHEDLPPWVPPRTELDLLRQYLDKNHAYRAGNLRFAPRILALNWMVEGLANAPAHRLAWRNAPLLGGAHSLDLIEAESFRFEASSLLAVQQAWGGFDALNVNPGFAYPVRRTADLARNAITSRTAILLVDASYLGDFDSENNFLRALLTCPEGGLAVAYAGFVDWDLRPLARGQPLGDALLATLANDQLIDPAMHTYVAILGDPTLRFEPAAAAAPAPSFP
jgi:hypothetical protein